MEVKRQVVGQYKFNVHDGKERLLQVSLCKTGATISLHWAGGTPNVIAIPIDAARELQKFLAEYLPEEEA